MLTVGIQDCEVSFGRDEDAQGDVYCILVPDEGRIAQGEGIDHEAALLAAMETYLDALEA